MANRTCVNSAHPAAERYSTVSIIESADCNKLRRRGARQAIAGSSGRPALPFTQSKIFLLRIFDGDQGKRLGNIHCYHRSDRRRTT